MQYMCMLCDSIYVLTPFSLSQSDVYFTTQMFEYIIGTMSALALSYCILKLILFHSTNLGGRGVFLNKVTCGLAFSTSKPIPKLA